jgi:hypothetical protein
VAVSAGSLPLGKHGMPGQINCINRRAVPPTPSQPEFLVESVVRVTEAEIERLKAGRGGSCYQGLFSAFR